jgi:hypothetical protein
MEAADDLKFGREGGMADAEWDPEHNARPAADHPGVPKTPADGSPSGGAPVNGAEDVVSVSERTDLFDTVAALTGHDLDPVARRRLLTVVHQELRELVQKDAFRPRVAVRWMVGAVADIAPRIPIRDLETLRRHHPELTGDALADQLIRNAAWVTTSIGGASGAVAAAEWVAPPTLLSAPVLIAVETVAVVAVEVKLIAELQEVYGQPVPGTSAQRGVALLRAWSHRRGVHPLTQSRGMAVALGTAARKELRDRLVRRFGRNISTLGPLLTGAVVAGFLNRRATLALGAEVSRDLRPHKVIEPD